MPALHDPHNAAASTSAERRRRVSNRATRVRGRVFIPSPSFMKLAPFA
jgi:hypothetical protein